MSNDDIQGYKPHDDSTDERTDCGCTEELACFEHYTPTADNAECDGDGEAVTALCDGGDTVEISLGDTVHIEGVPPTVEVAMFTHGGDSVVLETVDADEIREYIIPKAVIENGHIAVPA
jgi:hypothetical protein